MPEKALISYDIIPYMTHMAILRVRHSY